MRKTLSLITVLLGFLQIVFGGLMLGQIGDLSIGTINGSSRDIYAIFIVILGMAALWIGFFTWKNPGSSSSIILLTVFTINVIILIINGWSNWLTLPLLIINSTCSLTMLTYLLITNLKKTHNKNR